MSDIIKDDEIIITLAKRLFKTLSNFVFELPGDILSNKDHEEICCGIQLFLANYLKSSAQDKQSREGLLAIMHKEVMDILLDWDSHSDEVQIEDISNYKG